MEATSQLTTRSQYDVVIVGARAAGASTALLLARAGLRVLAIDRQSYGSDTLSSHALMRGAVCVFTGMPPSRFCTEAKQDIARTHLLNLQALSPALAEAADRATPISSIRSFPGMPGQFRKPHGPGWALVGDAGYFKDPYAAHGISDAFRDAELVASAVLTGDFAGYEATRNELSMPLFETLERIASYEWNLAELQGLHFDLSKAMQVEDRATSAITTSPTHSSIAA